MNIIEVDSFLAFTLAIVLLFVGKLMTKKVRNTKEIQHT